jgi:outer membrane receptor protein involved in Fe transport
MSPKNCYVALRVRLLLAFCFLTILQHGFAQQKAEPATEATTAAKEIVVELPPFEVRTDKDVGYIAQNTTSGSRLNTSLKDTAAPVSVFTQEFLNDIGVTDIAALADYTLNTERVNGFVGDVANGNEFSGATSSQRVFLTMAACAPTAFRVCATGS